jgi:hypothetical protein
MPFAAAGDTMMAGLEIALLPPLVRFFLGFFGALIITSGSILLLYWMARGEE